MRHPSLRDFRRFAPAVLASTLVVLAISDVGANCLAAWLCAPAPVAHCPQGSTADGQWQPGADACGFEQRVHRAPRKTGGDEPALELLPTLASGVPALPAPIPAHPRPRADASSPPGPVRPPYVLQHALLI